MSLRRRGFGGVRVALRTIAVLIAIAAVVDPAWSVDRPDPERLVVVDLVAGDAQASLAAIQAALAGWDVEAREGESQSIPCSPGERCVIVADGSISAPLPLDLRPAPSLIAARSDRAPNVAIRSVSATAAHVAAAGALRVELKRSGSVAETAIVVRDGAAVVGSATHKWGAGATATIDVPWWPLDAGARALRIDAAAVSGESTTVDNVIDVGVPVLSDRVRVVVFDARPSWNSTFVRRALEDDPRMEVEHRARVAPALTAGTRNGVLDATTLESAPVAVVGDPDALTPADVALLERYVRVRGGSLILLPERRITGPAARLLAGEWTEHLVPAPERVGAFHASEMLRVANLPPTAAVIAQSGGAPSIVSMPLGEGRVIVSGAMDAWRFRDPAFAHFWQSAVVEAGLAGASVKIDVGSTLASSGTRVPFTVRARSFDAKAAVEVEVVVQCGEAASSPVRVWPSGSMNEFTGDAPVTNTTCELEAKAGDRVATAHVAVARDPSLGAESTLAKLEQVVSAAGGTVSTVGNEAALAEQLATSFTPTSQIVSIRPMHALWWMFPFAGCLAAEWWLRRREGLR